MNSARIQLPTIEMRKSFTRDLERGLAEFVDLKSNTVVVGIPFHDEDDTLPGVVRTVRAGLEAMGLANRSAVVCVGSHVGGAALRRALDASSSPGVPTRGFLLGRGLEGRGWGIRALLEVARRYKAHLIVVPPDLAPQADGGNAEGAGFSPHWVSRLAAPVLEHGADLALARFNRHPLANSVESLFAFPLLEAVFRLRVAQPIPGVFAMSPRLISLCIDATDRWSLETGTYGFDAWLIIRAIVEGAVICEVPLGSASFRHHLGKLKLVFRQTAQVMMEQIVEHSRWWLDRPATVASPYVLGTDLDKAARPYEIDTSQLVQRLKAEFDHFDQTMLQETLPEEAYAELEALARGRRSRDGGAAAQNWSDSVFNFALTYAFDTSFHPDDVVDALYPPFLARLVARVEEIGALTAGIGADREGLVRHEAERVSFSEADAFLGAWPAFHKAWRERERDAGSYLPRVVSWEFVPHVGVVVPQELRCADGSSVWAHEVYSRLIERYRNQFRAFVTERLDLPHEAVSADILDRVEHFMVRLEELVDRHWLTGDLSDLDTVRECTDRVVSAFARGTSFQLTAAAIVSLLKRNPPRNLMTNLGTADIGELLNRVSPNDALGMTALTDRQEYLSHVLDTIEREAEPDWFHVAPLKPMVLDISSLAQTDDVRATAALARLAGRLVVGTRVKGWDGAFPKVWFLLLLAKRIIGVEMFGDVWEELAAQGVEFGKRVAATVRGHWGRRVLSAHNAFENRHQRILAKRLARFAAELASRAPEAGELAVQLNAAASVYHLSITLPDATFVPLSAWTWASYSARGGTGAPTPLSSLVERDWASRDFLTAYLERAGLGDADTVSREVRRLVMDGRESLDLGERLLGLGADQERLFVSQMPRKADRQAGPLVRPTAGPILEPIKAHRWESRYVLNAAAVRLDGLIYILYRAYGDEEISRIGLAWTRDGVTIEGRLDEPIFGPANQAESAGCEDPRVTVIGERMYMLYTAWDRVVPQIAMASMPVQAFLDRRWDMWKRHGLGFPGLSNKDATLYPRTFNGKYALYHRIDPNMWISYLDTLDCPWPRTGHRIVVGPRPGMMWDGLKIGAGAQPIETTRGWLNIYHGVDYEHSYRLGVLFTDLEDPSKVLYQSPNPILEPSADFAIGRTDSGDFWVPRVVFTCGAVPAQDKQVIDLDDEVLVYYGAADTAIGVARGKLRELVPILE